MLLKIVQKTFLVHLNIDVCMILSLIVVQVDLTITHVCRYFKYEFYGMNEKIKNAQKWK